MKVAIFPILLRLILPPKMADRMLRLSIITSAQKAYKPAQIHTLLTLYNASYTSGCFSLLGKIKKYVLT